MKEKIWIFILNIVLFFIVIFNEIYKFDYYKEKSSDADIVDFNTYMTKKSKQVDINSFKSWKNPNVRSIQMYILVITKFRDGISDSNQYFHFTMQSIIKSIYFAKQKTFPLVYVI